MRLLVLGSNGQVGRELKNICPESITLTKNDCDITDSESVKKAFDSYQPTHVINCAAYNKVDKAEDEKELANLINADSIIFLVQNCLIHDTVLIHYSSDYVFDGWKESAYSEEDLPNPSSTYGITKYFGEKRALAYSRTYLIRTSWVFGDGNNFVKKIWDKINDGETLKVVNDQYGSPTYAKDLAKSTIELIKSPYPYGIYHRTNSGSTSWFNLAEEVIKYSGKKVELIPISSNDLNGTKRPKNSILASKLPPLRNWKEALHEYLQSMD